MIEPTNKKFAILGHPLDHSLSPKIHTRVFQALDLPYTYDKIEIDPVQFDQKIQDLKNKQLAGFNITVPFKSQIMSHLDKIDSVAKQIGAVNTVRQEPDGSWIGFNTDYIGFLRALPNGGRDIQSTLLIGAGGAARAVTFGILSALEIKDLAIINRSQERAEGLISDLRPNASFSANTHSFEDRVEGHFDLIVNATTLGLSDSAEIFPFNPTQWAHPKTVFYDLIYKDKPTSFLKLASKNKLKTINGWPMLVFQAEEAFRIWTDRSFPDTVRKELLNEY